MVRESHCRDRACCDKTRLGSTRRQSLVEELSRQGHTSKPPHDSPRQVVFTARSVGEKRGPRLPTFVLSSKRSRLPSVSKVDAGPGNLDQTMAQLPTTSFGNLRQGIQVGQNRGASSVVFKFPPVCVNIRGCLVGHRQADCNSSDPRQPSLRTRMYGYPPMSPMLPSAWLQIAAIIWNLTTPRVWMPWPGQRVLPTAKSTIRLVT